MSGITHEWNGTILTITSDAGTSSADLKGEKGDDGVRGPQGIAGAEYVLTEEDKTEISGEVKSIVLRDNLTASDNTVFRFGVDAEGKYGYVITDSEGADTVIPFSNDEEFRLMIVGALQYSGLGITAESTWEEIIAALEKQFPETYVILYNFATVTTEYTNTKETITAYGSDKLDLTRAKTLKFTVDSTFKSGGYFYDMATFSVGISSVKAGELEQKVDVWDAQNGENFENTYTNTGVVTLDVSSLTGEYYVGIQVFKRNSNTDGDCARNVQGIATITEFERIV
jgi:hypothetical protein